MYVCEFQGCKAKYHRHREYVSHLSINHPSNRSGYMCGFKSRDSQQCSMRLSSLRDLKQHVICIHKASRSLQPSSLQVSEVVIRCKQAKCMGYMASTQSTFYKHLREIHGGNEEKQCYHSSCQYRTANIRNLQRHLSKMHRQHYVFCALRGCGSLEWTRTYGGNQRYHFVLLRHKPELPKGWSSSRNFVPELPNEDCGPHWKQGREEVRGRV